jgi:hypothetical protein
MERGVNLPLGRAAAPSRRSCAMVFAAGIVVLAASGIAILAIADAHAHTQAEQRPWSRAAGTGQWRVTAASIAGAHALRAASNEAQRLSDVGAPSPTGTAGGVVAATATPGGPAATRPQTGSTTAASVVSPATTPGPIAAPDPPAEQEQERPGEMGKPLAVTASLLQISSAVTRSRDEEGPGRSTVPRQRTGEPSPELTTPEPAPRLHRRHTKFHSRSRLMPQ